MSAGRFPPTHGDRLERVHLRCATRPPLRRIDSDRQARVAKLLGAPPVDVVLADGQ